MRPIKSGRNLPREVATLKAHDRAHGPIRETAIIPGPYLATLGRHLAEVDPALSAKGGRNSRAARPAERDAAKKRITLPSVGGKQP